MSFSFPFTHEGRDYKAACALRAKPHRGLELYSFTTNHPIVHEGSIHAWSDEGYLEVIQEKTYLPPLLVVLYHGPHAIQSGYVTYLSFKGGMLSEASMKCSRNLEKLRLNPTYGFKFWDAVSMSLRASEDIGPALKERIEGSAQATLEDYLDLLKRDHPDLDSFFGCERLTQGERILYHNESLNG